MVKFLDKAIENIIRIVYSKEKKYARYVLGLTLVGFIVRLIAALNLNALADDMVYASQSAGIIKAGIISTHSNPPLFFYMTDLVYHILGYTVLASRFWPLIAGTLLIPLTYLLGKKMFNEKTGLIAAFLITFANFMVRMTFSEQSLVVLFFCFFAIYLGMIYLDNRNKKYLIASAIMFGLGALTKYNTPFFVITFLIFSAFYIKSKGELIFSKKNMKLVFLFLIIIFVFAVPFIAFNYFIFKENGITDVYFSRIIPTEKTQQLYSGLAGQEKSFFENVSTVSNYLNWNLVYHTDLLLCILFVLGIGLMIYKKEKMNLAFIALFLIVPFVLQSAGSTLSKHFVFMYILFALPSAYFLEFAFNKVKNKYIVIAILILIAGFMFINIGHAVATPQDYSSKSELSQLKDYINSKGGDNKLFVFDDRMYTSKIFWAATDNNFVTLGQLPYLLNYSLSSKTKINVKVQVVECAIDDCGWGWVASKQDLNQSEEYLLSQVKDISKLDSKIYYNIYSGNEITGKKEKEVYYNIYSFDAQLDPQIINQARKTHEFYFVPYMYENMNNYLYNYQVFGIDELINKSSWLIIWIAVLLAILSFIVIIIVI